jgi:Fe-S cluster biogenesis protein NfuA
MLMTEQAETAQTAMKEKVEAALVQVRPMLQRDGGDVELVEITDDGIVRVRLQGACQGCPMAQITLQMGIERVLKEMVPDIKSVQAVA